MPVRTAAAPNVDVAPMLLELRCGDELPQWLELPDGKWMIGTGNRCDLLVAGSPSLHSLLQRQGASLWIEAVDEQAQMRVNGQPVRRLALRDGDRIAIAESELLIHVGPSVSTALRRLEAEQEASLLSAEELCDRIVEEEQAIEEFQGRRRLGWQALLAAVKDSVAEDVESEADSMEDARYDQLLDQIRSMSDILEDRTRALASRESELLETSSQLQSVQEQMARQLDELMQRLNQQDSVPDELRASA